MLFFEMFKVFLDCDYTVFIFLPFGTFFFFTVNESRWIQSVPCTPTHNSDKVLVKFYSNCSLWSLW